MPKTNAELMQNAHTDLCGSLEGQFSPDDWRKIMVLAEGELLKRAAQYPLEDREEAWRAVVRDFHQARYWGFKNTYRAPKEKIRKRPANLGLLFIWMLFNTLTIMKVAVLWFGQIYSRSEDPADTWMFFAVLAFSLAGFVYFLWKHHDHPDDLQPRV